MVAVDLRKEWGKEQDKAFLALKTALTSQPVLRGPQFDGTLFIVMTDGLKEGKGAMLSQQFTYTLNGKTVTRVHPIAYASKWTSTSEEKYKPYLLELAALKFALKKFSDIVYGFPIEIETNCLALQDSMTNSNLSATHARWLEYVLSFNIVDVRHIPGSTNLVCDALSRKGTDGSATSVSLDWFSSDGLAFDIYSAGVVPEDASDTTSHLLEQLKGVPAYTKIIKALGLLEESSEDSSNTWHAEHWAAEYMVEDGRLWHIGGGNPRQA